MRTTRKGKEAMEFVNPMEKQGPLNQKPEDDQMLDELEHSIKNPPGFVEPLAVQDEPFMEDLAKQLDKIEASIEGTFAPPSGSKVLKDQDEPNTQTEESSTSEVPHRRGGEVV